MNDHISDTVADEDAGVNSESKEIAGVAEKEAVNINTDEEKIEEDANNKPISNSSDQQESVEEPADEEEIKEDYEVAADASKEDHHVSFYSKNAPQDVTATLPSLVPINNTSILLQRALPASALQVPQINAGRLKDASLDTNMNMADNDITGTNNSTSTSRPSLSIPQQQNIIRTVTVMFRQQAHLCNQQAHILEHISRNIHDKEKWFEQQQQGEQEQDSDRIQAIAASITTRTTANADINTNTNAHVSDSDLRIQQRVEREAVVRLATKSYQGMKELQKTMKAFLKSQQQQKRQNGRHSRDNDDDESSSSSEHEYNAQESYVTTDDPVTDAVVVASTVTTRDPNLKRERDEDSSSDDSNSDNDVKREKGNPLPLKRDRDDDDSSSEQSSSSSSSASLVE